VDTPRGVTPHTDRLTRRPMVAEDAGADALLGVFGDPAVMAAFHVPPFGPDEMRR
jgi:hypothetical protein